MRDTTVHVQRSTIVDATSESAWALLSSPAAWSLMQGASFAFAVAGSPAGVGRLIATVGVAPAGVSGGVLEVIEESPGELLRVQSRSRIPVGRHVFTVQTGSHRKGLRLSVGLDTVAPRASKIDADHQWQRTLEDWLGALKAVLEGRAPWPGTDMPADAQRAWADRPAPAPMQGTTAAVVVGAPAAAVWRAVRSLEAARMATGAVYSGRVPGTPELAVGEMRYFIRRHEDNRLAGTVTMVAELADGHSVLARRVGRPHDELRSIVAANGTGTRLELTGSWPAPGDAAEQERMRQRVAGDLQARVESYKRLIEDSADPS
jgi:hypothetical protein